MAIEIGTVRVTCPDCGSDLDVPLVATLAEDSRAIEIRAGSEQFVREHVATHSGSGGP